ncbi:MAG: hypothetical protein HOP33_23490 [Verrucomicrobia bacterium]|nr:hypothetical protein [Verrucomicrobiota bacterium]
MRQYEVIIPVRNGGQALVNSILSVSPSLKSGSVLLTISDNFSNDGSPWKQLLQSLPQDQWRLISPPESLGRVEHWSWAFAQGQCPWIKPLMTGDRIDDAFWDWADRATVEFPQVGMLFCSASLIDPAAAHPEIIAKPSASAPTRLYNAKQFSDDAIRCLNLVGALSQMMVRADVMKKSLPFEPEFAWTADWRMYRRCFQQMPAAETRARFVCLDRSIARLSTSWKGLRGSFREEWKFAVEQASLSGASAPGAFIKRCKAIGIKIILVFGRKLLPRAVRGFLTSITGWHKRTSLL